MTPKLDSKTIEALKWIVDILNRLNINYQISGGLAGKFFGSKRDLNDIDIDISENDFKTILPEIEKYIIYGPSRYKDLKWDLELITLNYNGQEIDISGAESLRISNKERTSWISFHVDFSKSQEIVFNEMKLKIVNPKDFIDYKKELDGEHQKEDIDAAMSFLMI